MLANNRSPWIFFAQQRHAFLLGCTCTRLSRQRLGVSLGDGRRTHALAFVHRRHFDGLVRLSLGRFADRTGEAPAAGRARPRPNGHGLLAARTELRVRRGLADAQRRRRSGPGGMRGARRVLCARPRRHGPLSFPPASNRLSRSLVRNLGEGATHVRQQRTRNGRDGTRHGREETPLEGPSEGERGGRMVELGEQVQAGMGPGQGKEGSRSGCMEERHKRGTHHTEQQWWNKRTLAPCMASWTDDEAMQETPGAVHIPSSKARNVEDTDNRTHDWWPGHRCMPRPSHPRNKLTPPRRSRSHASGKSPWCAPPTPEARGCTFPGRAGCLRGPACLDPDPAPFPAPRHPRFLGGLGPTARNLPTPPGGSGRLFSSTGWRWWRWDPAWRSLPPSRAAAALPRVDDSRETPGSWPRCSRCRPAPARRPCRTFGTRAPRLVRRLSMRPPPQDVLLDRPSTSFRPAPARATPMRAVPSSFPSPSRRRNASFGTVSCRAG
eukprot:scaffold1401_cov330-Pavlova_lutheri.AAC.54